MKYIFLILLLSCSSVFADYYDVQVPTGESFVIVVDGVATKDASGRYFSYSRAVVEAAKRKDKCKSACDIYVRMIDLKIDGKLIRESSSSSSTSSATSSKSNSSAAVSSAASTKISMFNATACEDGQALPYDKITRYEAIVVSDGVTRFVEIPKTPDPVVADIGVVKSTDSVRAATVAIECGGTQELYSKWVTLQ